MISNMRPKSEYLWSSPGSEVLQEDFTNEDWYEFEIRKKIHKPNLWPHCKWRDERYLELKK